MERRALAKRDLRLERVVRVGGGVGVEGVVRVEGGGRGRLDVVDGRAVLAVRRGHVCLLTAVFWSSFRLPEGRRRLDGGGV